MKKILGAVFYSLLASAVIAGASTGNCEKKAASLKSSQTVTLVDEWDPEFGEYWGFGVYYYKISLKKGASATIWLEGGDTENMSLDVYTSWDDEFYTSFSDFGETDDGKKYYRLYPEDWYEEDPSTVTFYVFVSGEIGERATLNFSPSEVQFVPEGASDNPLALTVTEKMSKVTKAFVDGEYYLTAKLTAGRYYRFYTEGGTPEASLSFSIEGSDYVAFKDAVAGIDTNNFASVVVPAVTRTYTIAVNGVGDSFTFAYQMIPARKISDHPATVLVDASGYSAEFIPGRRVATWDYADSIVDEQLFKISLNAGDRYAFETSGATNEIEMILYDSTGKELAKNKTKDGESFDVRVAFEAAKKGEYYIGVCNPVLEPGEAFSGKEISISARNLAAVTDVENDEFDPVDDENIGATGLVALPGTDETDVFEFGAVHGPHTLSITDWSDTYVIAARKGLRYRLGFAFSESEKPSKLNLAVKVFTLSGLTEKEVLSKIINLGAGNAYIDFTASANAAHYVRVQVADGQGADFGPYNVYALAYNSDKTAPALGILTVKTYGTESAMWTLNKETVKYPGGASVLVSGENTVKFATVKGFSTPVAQTVTVNAGVEPTVVEAYYSDAFDPKDDVAKTATALTFKNTPVQQSRTLWNTDAEDNFSFAAKDGQYYSIALEGNIGDAVFSITNAEVGVVVENVKSIDKIALAGVKSKYYLTVKHANAEEPQDGAYTLSGFFANVGAIKFAKDAVSSKENAASVKLTVNRTAKDGLVRVKYGTVAGSALPGVDYVAQNGVLEWKNGDNKAKTIEIKLIPDLVANWESNKTFSVQLKGFAEEELGADEYPAQMLVDECVVTLTEVSRAGTTVESTYADWAKKNAKVATVKTENVALETGTFYGVLSEDGSALTNGFPRLASVTLTVSAKTPAALSANVALGGKSYTFKATGWNDAESDATNAVQTMSLEQKVAGITYTSTLRVAVSKGTTTNSVDWVNSVASVELEMNVPDSKGVQENIYYTGSLYRNNAKVQEYFNAVTNFVGYYTVALVPDGVYVSDGIPAGNGYLTLQISNKGDVKVAGMLADGKTKPSMSVKACSIRADEESANGYAMYVPIYFAKSPCCFGGELRIFKNDAGKLVVDSTLPLVWYNDDAKLTYYNDGGYGIEVIPAGGWYDTIINLQSYYLNRAFETSTAEIYEFPEEAVAAGFQIVTEVEPNMKKVDLVGDQFSFPKKSLVKNGKIYDLTGSVNPCNIQIKLARATGIVTGSFSIWSENEAGTTQKEITGFKHNGVLILSADEMSPLDPETVTAGFCTKNFKVTDENPQTGKKSSRSWDFSAPFNILGIDQGDQDWWADDWGISPEN